VSDWGGTNSTVESLNAGLDLEMPGPTVKRKIKDVQQAVEDGKIDPKVIDTSALRVLEFLVKTGKFENPDSTPERSVVNREHSRLIRKSGADGIVLLCNENGILPLQREKVKSVALLGLAKECPAFGGGSAKVNCHYKITPYDAIQEVLAGTNAEVRYAKGAPTFRNFEPWKDDIYDLEGKPGLTLSRYGNRDQEGPAHEISSIPSGSYQPNFQDSKSRDINASFKLEGTFRPVASGKHNLGFSAMGPSKLFINDELLFECGNNDDPVAFLLAVNGEEQRSYDFVQGQNYQVRLESKARLTRSAAPHSQWVL
jgi:beta-glucosidase